METEVLVAVAEMAARASRIGEAAEMVVTSAVAMRMEVQVALAVAAVAAAIPQADGSIPVVLEPGPRDLCSAVMAVMGPSTEERAAAALQRLAAHFLRGREPMFFATVPFLETRPFPVLQGHRSAVVLHRLMAWVAEGPLEQPVVRSPWTTA